MTRPADATRLLSTALICLAAAPPLLSLALVLRYSVNVPFWDDYQTPGLLYYHVLEGDLATRHFLEQHTNSRPVFPRLIFMLLGFGTGMGWSIRVATFVNWLLVVATFLIGLELLSGGSKANPLRSFFVLLFSLLLFSPAQYSNQLWAVQLIYFLALLCLVMALRLQRATQSRAVLCIGAATLSFIATFTVAVGLAVWIFAFPVLGMRLLEPRSMARKEWGATIRWSAIYAGLALGTFVLYFWIYVPQDDQGSFSTTVREPATTIRFFLAWLGGPLAQWGRDRLLSASAVGSLLLVAMAAAMGLFAFHWRQSRDVRFARACYPWICLMAFGLATGLATALGRVGFGPATAIVSRYATPALWPSLGFVGLLHALLSFPGLVRARPARGALVAASTSLLVAALVSWPVGMERMEARSLMLQQHLLSLRLYALAPGNPLLDRLHAGHGERVGEFATRLSERGLFELAPVESWLLDELNAPDGDEGGSFRAVTTRNGQTRLTGHAILPDEKRSADFVAVGRPTDAGSVELLTAIVTGIRRPRVADVMGAEAVLRSGFEVLVPIAPSEDLALFAIDETRRKAYRLSRRRPRPPDLDSR